MSLLVLLTLLFSFSSGIDPLHDQKHVLPLLTVDTTYVQSEKRPSLDGTFLVYPSPIYSLPTGFGLKFGYRLDHLFTPQSRLLVQFLPAQHLGRYSATYYLRDPDKAGPSGLVNVYYERTGRQWFYGLGPTSESDAQTILTMERLEYEARAGINLVGRSIRLQPFLRFGYYRIRDYSADPPDGLHPAVRSHLVYLTEDPFNGHLSTTTYGLNAGVDTRDQIRHPDRGLFFQVSGQRTNIHNQRSSYLDTFQFHLYGFIPVRPNHVLSLRFVTFLTRSSNTIPFFLYPVLDGEFATGLPWNRYYGNDLLSFGFEYRFPILYFLNYIGLEGLVSFDLASIYDNMVDQYTPAVTFKGDLSPTSGTIPLRPSLGIGAQILSLYEDRIHIRGIIGKSADGFTLVRFSFVHNLFDVSLDRR